MISYTSSQGQRCVVKKGKTLGQGEFGTVFTLKNTKNQPLDLVCKKIVIQAHDGLSAKSILLSTVNELNILKQLGLLKGYQRRRNTFYIVIKKIEGKSAQGKNGFKPFWSCFRAFRGLHRQNVAHFDTHPGNYILSKHSEKAHAIDFSLSQEATYVNMGWDFFDFSCNFHVSYSALFRFYVKEMLEYVNQHRFECVQKILFTGALVLGAIYGIPVLGVTHLLVQELILCLLVSQFGKEIVSKGLNNAIGMILGLKIDNVALIKKILTVLDVLQSCLSIYFMYSLIHYHWLKGGALMAQFFQCGASKGWQTLFQQASKEVLAHTALLYYPIMQILENLSHLLDHYVLCDSCLKNKADLFFRYPAVLDKKMDPNVGTLRSLLGEEGGPPAFPGPTRGLRDPYKY